MNHLFRTLPQRMLSRPTAFLLAVACTVISVFAQMVDPSSKNSCFSCTTYQTPGTSTTPFVWKSPSKDDFSTGTCIYRYNPPASSTLRKDLCIDWFFYQCYTQGGVTQFSTFQNCVASGDTTLRYNISSASLSVLSEVTVAVGLAVCLVNLW